MVDSTLNINIKSDKANRDVNKLDKNLAHLKGTGDKTTSTFKKLGTAIAAAIAVEAIRRAGMLADSYTNIENRLKLVTNSQDQFNEALERLDQISTDTFSSLEGNVNAFQRLSVATESLGISQARLLDVQEALSQTFRISGTDAVGAAAASIQLAQGLGAGALRGDEFRSVAEQNVKLLQLLAKELNVSTGELKDLASQGKITAEVVTNALAGSLEELRAEAEVLAPTMKGAFLIVTNALILVTGEINEATGAGEGLAGVLIEIAAALKENAENIGAFISVINLLFSVADRAFDAVVTSLNLLGSAVGSIAGAVNAILGGASIGAAFEAMTASLSGALDTFLVEAKTDSADLAAVLAEVATNFKLAFDPEPPSAASEALKQVLADTIAIKDVAAEAALAYEQFAADAASDILVWLDAIDSSSKGVDNLIDEVIKLGETMEEQEKVFERNRDLLEDFAGGLASSFVDAESSFSDFAESFLKDIAKMIIQTQLLAGLKGIFGGTKIGATLFGFADGAAFSGGNVIPFANGGVVNKPTLFPMANGAGLMGEAGPEAILPLSRGSDGKLGVKSTGGGVVVNVINNSTGTQIEQQTSSDGARIDVIISDIVKQGFADGSFDATLRQSFNVRRAGR